MHLLHQLVVYTRIVNTSHTRQRFICKDCQVLSIASGYIIIYKCTCKHKWGKNVPSCKTNTCIAIHKFTFCKQSFTGYYAVLCRQHLKWPMNILLLTHAQVHRERKCQVNKWTYWMPTHRPKQFLWCPSERLLAISPCWKVAKLRTNWNVSFEYYSTDCRKAYRSLEGQKRTRLHEHNSQFVYKEHDL